MYRSEHKQSAKNYDTRIAKAKAISTVAVKMLDTPHKQTNKKQPFLRLLISFWFQNNRLEISFSEHIEPFHSYEYEQSYAIFSD